MKKQSERTGGVGTQLGFELESTVQSAGLTGSSATVSDESATQGSVVDLTPRLRRRAAESDRALIKAVQSRAAHLVGCLRKQP